VVGDPGLFATVLIGADITDAGYSFVILVATLGSSCCLSPRLREC
jgi:hypothetical protein